jgi:DNA-binding transcriptional ArsR family regulator
MHSPATVRFIGEAQDPQEERLDRVFFALCDPVRRAILVRLDEAPLLVSELASPFDISLQAVSRHIQVLVRAGLVQQERTGRISRCSLDAGPMFAAAVWVNRYSKYWQAQFDTLAQYLQRVEQPGATKTRRPGRATSATRPSAARRPAAKRARRAP